MQFYTLEPRSILDVNHKIYERGGISNSAEERKMLIAQMSSNWSNFKDPLGSSKLMKSRATI